MGLNASKAPSAGGDRVEQEALKPDLYPARVVQVIDFGLQPQRAYKGKEKPPINMINLTYELSEEFMKDEEGVDQEDKPRWLGETIPFHNIKAEKAKSTRRMKAIDAAGTTGNEFTERITMPCQVAVVNNEKDGHIYNNIGDVSGPVNLKGYVQPELVNDPKVFVLAEPDLEIFESLPDWMQDMIKANLEYNGSKLQALLGEEAKPEPEPAKAAEPPAPPSPPKPPSPPSPAQDAIEAVSAVVAPEVAVLAATVAGTDTRPAIPAPDVPQ